MTFLNKDKIEWSINERELRFDFFPLGKVKWGVFFSIFVYYPSIQISRNGISSRFDSRFKILYESTKSPFSSRDLFFSIKILGFGLGFESHSSD